MNKHKEKLYCLEFLSESSLYVKIFGTCHGDEDQLSKIRKMIYKVITRFAFFSLKIKILCFLKQCNSVKYAVLDKKFHFFLPVSTKSHANYCTFSEKNTCTWRITTFLHVAFFCALFLLPKI